MTGGRARASRWLEGRWYEGGAPFVLRPLSHAFKGAVHLRRWAYGVGLLSSVRFDIPVIVVGNLSVGGTGKTPLSIWLVQLLKDAGFRPGVVSRGYGGRGDRAEPATVNAGSDPAVWGDEPVLIATRTAVPVMVGRDRVAAARALLDEEGCNVLVADDGLQHYRLQRDIEILLLDGERRLGNGYCLPAGPLREPAERALAADFIVCRGGVAQSGEYPMILAGGLAENLADSHEVPLAEFRGRPLHAVAGIGNPEQFFSDLRAAGLEIIAHDFPDHHPFQASDLAFNDELPILMTEKDAVKCRRFAQSRHWMLRVDAALPPAFGDALIQRLRTKHDG